MTFAFFFGCAFQMGFVAFHLWRNPGSVTIRWAVITSLIFSVAALFALWRGW